MKLAWLAVGVATFAFGQKAADKPASDVSEENKRIEESAVVLSEIMNAGDKGIPQDLLQSARCVAIVPGLKRAGFIVGGQYGKGILTCRLTNDSVTAASQDSKKKSTREATLATKGWSAPSTIRIEGGSIGFQIGAGETDLVLVVQNQRGMGKLMEDKFTVGGDAAVMAGPVGRTVQAKTDAQLHAEMLAWSRSRGVFAGVALDGATLRPDHDDNAKLYGKDVHTRDILYGKVAPPASANRLYAELTRWATPNTHQ